MSENAINQAEVSSAPIFEDTTKEAEEKKRKKKKLPTGAKIAIIVVAVLLVLAILGGAVLACVALTVGGVLIGIGLYFGLEKQEGDFVYRNILSGVQITSYTGASEMVEIPQTLGGKPVREIDSFVFASTSIRSITIPDTVEKIGVSAFEGCEHLEEVYFGSNVKEIERYAFYGCLSLKTIVLPVELEEIEEYSFGCCINLCEIYVPYKVETIGACAFESCDMLNYVYLENKEWIIEDDENSRPLHTYVTAITGCNDISYEEAVALLLKQVLCEYEWENVGSTVPQNDGTFRYITSGDTVEIVGLADNSLTGRVYIPESIDGKNVTGIQSYAFSNSNIKEIFIPDTVKSIGRSAFEGCKNLLGVEMGDGVEVIEPYAFAECRGLEAVALSESLVSIKSHAFYYCTSLESITIPAEVCLIEAYAFYGCEFYNVVFDDPYIWTVDTSEDTGSLTTITPTDLLYSDWSAPLLLRRYDDCTWEKEPEY